MNVTEAKKEIVRFMSGDSFDTGKMASAVHEVIQQAPDELVALRQAIFGENDDRCQDVSECLPDYLTLDEQAPAQMPDINKHLQSCPFCSAELAMLQEIVKEQRPAWETFAQQLAADEVKQPTLLVLYKNVWRWAKNQQQMLSEFTPKDVGKKIGDWLLQPPLEFAEVIRFTDTKPPFCLSICLPNNVAQVKLHIIPEHQAANNKNVWKLRLELDQASLLSRMFVDIRKTDAKHPNRKSLRKNRPVEFDNFEPPQENSYWIYFEWQETPGNIRNYETKVPLLSE